MTSAEIGLLIWLFLMLGVVAVGFCLLLRRSMATDDLRRAVRELDEACDKIEEVFIFDGKGNNTDS